jgi:hypothetical protein
LVNLQFVAIRHSSGPLGGDTVRGDESMIALRRDDDDDCYYASSASAGMIMIEPAPGNRRPMRFLEKKHQYDFVGYESL